MAKPQWSDKIEEDRQARLSSFGVSREAQEASTLAVASAERDASKIRVMSFNVLAAGLADDGFLVKPGVLAEWPAGAGKVPASGGKPVEFGTLVDEILNARGNEGALHSLKTKYDLPASRKNFNAIADWPARQLQIQRLILAQGCPDIVVLQELDNYAVMAYDLEQLGYTSKLPKCEAQYVPAHITGYTDKDTISAQKFCQAWEANGHAFLPHLDSNALHLSLVDGGFGPKILAAADRLGMRDKVKDPKTGRLSRGWTSKTGGSASLLKAAGVKDPSSLDDMGVAVFWRANRFSAQALKIKTYTGGGGGMVQVRLRDLSNDDRELVVIGSHLSSGDSIKDEQKRLDNEVEDANGGCLKKCAAECSSGGDPVVLLLDANSSPQSAGIDGSSSCWRSLHGALGASVWDSYFEPTGAVKVSDGLDPPVTSNKVRGPLSGQAKKIGAHAYSLIDHIFFTPSSLEMRGHVLPPTRFASSTVALQAVQPSLANPSDHYPVVVDLAWMPVAGVGLKKRKIGGA